MTQQYESVAPPLDMMPPSLTPFRLAALLLILLIAGTGEAQENTLEPDVQDESDSTLAGAEPDDVEKTENDDKIIPAVRTDTPPVIDGDLSDAAWEDAPLVSGFLDTRTDNLAVQQTFARILYDDNFIYLAFENIEDPKTIVSTVRKYDQGNIRREDYIQVGFDTFFDKTRAYLFLVNPLGTRWDGRDAEFGRNDAWDAEWQAASKILPDRWNAEMAIPISVMHHSSGENQTWGINFRRRDSDSNASSHWNYHSDRGVPSFALGPKFVADFGVFTGLDTSKVSIDKRPTIETLVAASVTKRTDGEVHSRIGAGLDLSMRLNANWIATLTAYPDFSEVDADEGDVQNRDERRFLFERRTFFNEGAEIFRTPINIYDSRNIIEIDSAIKISGTGPNWQAAALALEGEGNQSGNGKFVVARYIKDLSEHVQLGGMVIAIDRTSGFNLVGGIDARVELTDTTTWTSQFLQMEDKRTIVIEDHREMLRRVPHRKSGHAYETEFEGGTKPWFWSVDFKDISKEFQPDLSFVPRRDIIGPTGLVSFNLDMDEGPVEAYTAFFFFEHYKNHAGKTVLRDFFVQAGIEFQNNFDIEISRQEDFHKPFNNRRNEIEIDWNRSNRFKSFEVAFAWGEFQDVPFEQLDIEKPFRIGDRFTSELTATIRRESPHLEKDRDVWLVRLESEYTFAWEGRVKVTLEQASDKSFQRTLLFAYEDVKNWDFFFVLTNFGSSVGEIERQELFTKFVYRW